MTIDPRWLIHGARGIVDKLVLNAGLSVRPLSRRAPYGSSQALTRQDQLYLARHVPGIADIIIADYCFLTETFPYALRPDALTAVVMHHRFSVRGRQFDALGAEDSVANMSEEEECAKLGRADIVIAIQDDEANFVRNRLPAKKVIVAPMAASPIRSAYW